MRFSVTFAFSFAILLGFSAKELSAQKYVMSFDGLNDYVDLGSSVATGVRTIELRFKPSEDLSASNITSPRTLIGRNHLLINTYEFNLSFRSDGKLWFNVNSQGPSSSGGIVRSDTTSWQKNRWYYLVAVIDPVKGMAMYIDGVKQSQTVSTETSALGPLPYITTLGTWGDEYVRNFGGLMDEVRLWTRALDSIEIAQQICQISNPGLTPGLRAYYKMDEGLGINAIDSSLNSYVGSVSGATWIADSSCSDTIINTITPDNYVMYFDGINDYVDLDTSVATGVRTIEMRFKPSENLSASNITSPRTLIGRNHLLINTYEFNLSFRSDGKLWFNVNSQGPSSSGGIVRSDTTSWQKNRWYYLVAVIDPVKGMAMYIDGVKQSQTVSTETSALGPLPYITTLGTWGDEYVRNFGGLMDEVRLWTRALDSIEIAQKVCEISNPGLAAGLRAYYKMDEGSGLILIDSSNNSFTGDVSGAIWVEDSVCADTTPISTNSPGTYVMTFDGVNDFINLGNAVGNQLRAIEMYFQPTTQINASNYVEPKALIARNNGATVNNHEFNISFSSGGRLRFGLKDANGTLHAVFSDTVEWNAFQWYHIAAVIDPINGMRLYINGNKQSDTNNYTAPTGTINTITTIGTWGDEFVRNFTGNIDEVRLWKRSLSKVEIRAHMCGLDPTLEPMLIAYYQMNEGSGLSAIDSSLGLNNGAVNSANWKVDSICIVPGSNPLAISSVIQARSGLTTHPNPTSSNLTVSFRNKLQEIQKVKIYSIGGQLLHTELGNNSSTITINVSDLPLGYYLISLQDNNQRIHTTRFIVNR